MTRRRDLLKAAGAATVVIGTAGCFSRFLGGDDEDGSAESPQESAGAEQANSTEQGADEANTTEDASEERERNETEANASEDTTNESDLEDEDDSTRPKAEVIKDADAVETEAEAIRHETSVEVRGTVTNTSSNAIDQVSVEVVLYDAEGQELFREVDGTLGLAEWDTWDFSIVAEGTEYVEHVERYDVTVTAEQHQGE